MVEEEHQKLGGLTQEEAQRRLLQYGANAFERPKRKTLIARAAGVFREPVLMLLIAAVVLYLVLGNIAEGVFLAAGASVAIGLMIAQQVRSDRALAALRNLAEPRVRVIRDGEQTQIAARELVPGDLIVVGEGQRLPADGVLAAGDLLSIDESALTGESAPVVKQPGSSGPQANLFAGTLVVRGQGLARVDRTGSQTEFGRIGASLANIEDAPTPLQKATAKIISVLGVAAIVFCLAVVVAFGLIRGDWVEAMLSGLTAAIALIPEEFPMILTVFLAIGAWRLARHKVIVRKSAVIEALGAASVLCVDKTGTLTEGKMQLVRVWAPGCEAEISPKDEAAQAVIRSAALATPAHSVDPLDQAVLEFGRAEPASPLRTWPLSKERMAVVQAWRAGDDEILAAKGAPETIFGLCRLTESYVRPLQEIVERLASQGYRVLGAASWQGPEAKGEPEDVAFQFQGLLAFLDPIRPDVPAALAEARKAGVRVVMITGDHPATALAIARSAGMDVSAGVLTGGDIAAMGVVQLRRKSLTTCVFARVQPQQKLVIVGMLTGSGAIVAMTGDGVNDAPALQAAHIGIAMGQRGTDVAREAADIVLLDDSFASIIGGIRLGRRIFANLRKALTYVTAIHVPIAALALGPVLAGYPPMLFPMHVVLLELVIDPVCSLVFESEPSERSAMSRPPRHPDEPLFGVRQILLAGLQGAVVAAAVLAVYAWSLDQTTEAQARGLAFASLIVANIALAITDAASPATALLSRQHRNFWLIAAAALSVLALALFSPVFSPVFRVEPPALWMLGIAIVIGAVAGACLRPARLQRASQI